MTNPVSLSELEKALDDLIMQEVMPPLSETDITITRLVQRARAGENKIGDTRARAMLEKWVQEGKAEYIGKRREVRGHAVDAWRLIG